jgi:hypothetical protein
MLKCENHYFRIREYYFGGLLDYAFTPMSILELVKHGGASMLSTMSLIHNMSSILT